jgi:hypothetical protein
MCKQSTTNKIPICKYQTSDIEFMILVRPYDPLFGL